MHSGIYAGWVEHRRQTPAAHRFRYSLALAYLDLAEVNELFASMPRWFCSTKRGALLQFRREDYLGDPSEPLADAVRRFLVSRNIPPSAGPIRLLTQLRQVGYVFNPVSFYYCFDTDERLLRVIAEVSNTPWRERHWYVLENAQPGQNGAFPAVQKEFHVSPFMGMDLQYSWHLQTPGDELRVGIENHRQGTMFFDVCMQLKKDEFNFANLVRMLRQHPLQPQRVMLGIYWQALWLWWKRVPFVPHPNRAAGSPTPSQNLAPGESVGIPKTP